MKKVRTRETIEMEKKIIVKAVGQTFRFYYDFRNIATHAIIRYAVIS